MKILLTGAAGGIGSTLGYYLFSQGHELILADNLRNGYLENLTINGQRFGEFFRADICDFNIDILLKYIYFKQPTFGCPIQIVSLIIQESPPTPAEI